MNNKIDFLINQDFVFHLDDDEVEVYFCVESGVVGVVKDDKNTWVERIQIYLESIDSSDKMINKIKII